MDGGTSTRRADVAVIGGGLAGLTSAVALSGAGLDVVVLEAGERLGGRAQSWSDPVSGDPIHLGPHVFMSEYPNLLKLMELLGTRHRIVWQPDHFITMVHGREASVMRPAPLPAPFQFFPSLLADRHTSTRDLLSSLPATLYAMQLDEADVLRLDGMNAYAFLRRMGVTKSYLASFWSFASMAIMNVPVELCSAGALMRFFKRLIGQRRYYFGFPDGGLGDTFAPAATAWIERNRGRVLLGAKVAALEGTDRVTGVRLADGRRVEARFTIAALPPAALRGVLPREWLVRHRCFADLVHFHPSPYVSPYLWFDRKLTRLKMWARRHRPNDLNCDFYDLSNINRGWEERPSLIASNIIFCERARHLSDAEIVEATVRELSEFLPEARPERVRHAAVNRIPMAIHCPFPGVERKRPETRSPLPGLLLAGDWIRTRLPASMESAAMSGWRAAEAVLSDLGRPASLSVEHDHLEGLTALVDRAARWFPPRRLRRWMHEARGGAGEGAP